MDRARQRWALPNGHVDLERGIVYQRDEHVALTTKETQLLRYLAARAGEEVHRDTLLRDVWGFAGRLPASRAPDFVVRRLRAKIEPDPAEPTVLVTVHGHGYRLLPTECASPSVSPHHRPSIPPAGTPYDPAWYAPRPQEEAAIAALLAVPGAPVVLHGGQGQGKSWLLHHHLGRFEPEDVVVWLDAGILPAGSALEHIALEIVDTIGLGEDVVEAAWSMRGDPRRHLTRLLQQTALPAISGRLIVALDRADQLSTHDDPEGVYSLLRSLASRPGPPWDRLRLMLAVSTEPALLVQDPGASPFNLAAPVRIGGLLGSSVAWLAERSGIRWSDTELAELDLWLGGHPFLVRRALYAAASGTDKRTVLTDPAVYDDILRTRLGLLRERPDLSELVARLAAEPTATLEPLKAMALERASILRIEGGRARFASGLMERFFRTDR